MPLIPPPKQKKYDDAIEGVNRNEALKRTISKKPHHTTRMFGDDVTDSSHRLLPSGVSSKLPNRRRSIAAIAANRLVVPNIHMPVISEMDDTDAARLDALTTKGFARSMTKGSAASGMSSH